MSDQARANPSQQASSTGQALTDAGWLDAHFEANRPEYEAILRSVAFAPGWHVLDAGSSAAGSVPELAVDRLSTGINVPDNPTVRCSHGGPARRIPYAMPIIGVRYSPSCLPGDGTLRLSSGCEGCPPGGTVRGNHLGQGRWGDRQ